MSKVKREKTRKLKFDAEALKGLVSPLKRINVSVAKIFRKVKAEK